jgi:hypothetical protein
LKADFGHFSHDKVNFPRDLKSFVFSFDRVTLRKLVESQNGELELTLNGQKVVLKHRHHFWFDLRDMHTA